MQKSRVETIQKHKSLNKVPYPMIFMRGTPEEHLDTASDLDLKVTWDRQVNNQTAVTMESVRQRVEQLVSREKTPKRYLWPGSTKQSRAVTFEYLNETHSSPRLIQTRFDCLNRKLDQQRQQLAKKLLDQRSSRFLDQFELKKRAVLEQPKVFCTSPL